MKRILLLAIILVVLAALSIPLALAAPGDVVITFTIPAAKVADFSAGFLREVPIPLIRDPADPNQIIPMFTPKQWIKEWMRQQAMKKYRIGNIDLAKDAAVYGPNAMI